MRFKLSDSTRHANKYAEVDVDMEQVRCQLSAKSEGRPRHSHATEVGLSFKLDIYILVKVFRIENEKYARFSGNFDPREFTDIFIYASVYI